MVIIWGGAHFGQVSSLSQCKYSQPILTSRKISHQFISNACFWNVGGQKITPIKPAYHSEEKRERGEYGEKITLCLGNLKV